MMRLPDGSEIRLTRIVARCSECHTERKVIPSKDGQMFCPTCQAQTVHKLAGATWHDARRCTRARRRPAQ